MKPIYTCLIVSVIVFALTTIVWWVLFYSGLNVPEFIPNTPIKIYGLILFSIDLTALIIALKTIFRRDITISIFKLTLWGTLIMFLFESAFHGILSITYDEDKTYHYFHGVIVMTLYGMVMSFFIAFQLKTKKTSTLVGMVIIFGILLAIIEKLFPGVLKS